ncbi:MAG TPA: four helix bundle protein [Chlamydiales bacterium]|nr:four helix bundle protein [Chlamydiales bacterium]
MKIERFEDIVAWQKAKLLTVKIYHLFQSHKDYSFCDQIKRAALSIMSNIAEGFERKTNKEFRQFLYIAKGSCGEVRSLILFAQEIGYISSEQFTELYDQSVEISKILSGLIKSLSTV